jgi:hypothetical protein
VWAPACIFGVLGAGLAGFGCAVGRCALASASIYLLSFGCGGAS